jgi:hypothetical protein
MIYLTKNRLKGLDLALTMDDILYEKHRRLLEGLHKQERKLARMGNVARVVQEKDGVDYVLQIISCHGSEDGQIVRVK